MPGKAKKQPTITVHGLRGGFALCGFAATVPMNWPAGHYWVDPRHHSHDINCRACKAVVAEEAKSNAQDN